MKYDFILTILFQFVPDDSSIKSILDYTINFDHLEPQDTHYKAIGQFILAKNSPKFKAHFIVCLLCDPSVL